MPITATNPFKGRHYPGEVILSAVRWYLRYPLAYLHVSELLAERGLFVDASCVWRWVLVNVTAATIYSNFDPTSTAPFNRGGFAIGQVGDPAMGTVTNYEWATAFSVLGSAYQLDAITLALGDFAGAPALPVAITFQLHSSAQGM